MGQTKYNPVYYRIGQFLSVTVQQGDCCSLLFSYMAYFPLKMSGIARSNMPLLLNTTYIESLLFCIASSRFGYFSFGIIRSISCKEISLAFVEAFCLDRASFNSAFSSYNAFLCLSLASSS